MSLRAVLVCAGAVVALTAAAHASADPIPYPESGTYNAATYTFKATSTGDLIGYFAGSGASYDNMVGVLDNGVLTSGGFGLDDHMSSVGQSFDFGAVTAGDTLVFVLDNLTLGKDAYSDPSLNVAYDDLGYTGGHNHIYSTAYTATDPVFGGVPTGTYVAFEDQPFPASDYNYFDENFVFTGTTVTSSAPEPSTWLLMMAGVGGIGFALRQARKTHGFTFARAAIAG